LFTQSSSTMSIETIKDKVSQLDKAEQAELMHFMVELLAAQDNELSETLKKEIDAREIALENGTSVGKPAREVLSKYSKR